MAIDQKISDAWKRAADDLEIRVVAPFAIVSDGETWNFEALVLDFGSGQGAVVMSQVSERRLDRWFSILYPIYRQYERDHFIDTLNDWGWFGVGEPPAWYAGGRVTI